MKRKIIFSANSLWFLYNFYSGLMLEFKNIGFDVVAIGKCDHTFSLIRELGISAIAIPFKSKSAGILSNSCILFNYLKLFKKYRPVCILNFTIKANIYGAIIARLFSIPCVNTQPGLGTVFLHGGLKSVIAKILYKHTAHYPCKLFVLNDDDYQLLLNTKLVPPEKLEIVHGSGIDIEKFAPMLNEENGKGEIRLLYIGRLLKDKGIHELVDVLRKMRSDNIRYLCKFVGFIDADNVSAISACEINKWEKEKLIRYEGFTNDVRKFIGDSDVVVLPSYREGLPQSLLEASAMEKVIVATNIQGCKDIVLDGYNGFICEPKNPESLYAAIKKAVALSPERRVEMGKNGRKYVSGKFEKSIIYKRYLDIVKAITENIPEEFHL